MWNYFQEQFSEVRLSNKQLENYLGCFLDNAIKKGSVSKAISLIRETPYLLQRKEVKQSMLSEFEEKFAHYLQD